MLYLESTAVACYQAKEELNQNFSSIFGANERSRSFYKKYSDYIQMKDIGTYLMKKYGITPLIEILQYINVDTKQSIPLSSIWLCIAVIPAIITDPTEPDYIRYKEILLSRLNCVTHDDIDYIKSHMEETSYFLDVFSKEPQLSNNDSLIIKLIEGNILVEDPTQRIVDFPQIPSIPTLGKSYEDEKLTELAAKISSEIDDWNKEVNSLKEDLNKPKKQSLRISCGNKTCDQCEREVLENIERLLDSNRIEDVLELIKMRQEDIKQSEIDTCTEVKQEEDYVFIEIMIAIRKRTSNVKE